MALMTADPSSYGYALAVVLHIGLAVQLYRAWARREPGGTPTSLLLGGAVLVTAAWALVQLIDPHVRSAGPSYAGSALDIARYALWYGFLLRLLRPALAQPSATQPRLLAPAAALAVAISALELGHRALLGQWQVDASRIALATNFVLPLFGLVLVEQLFRNVAEESRWNAKPACLALAIVFGFDLYLFSEALLFGHLDPDASSIRGAVHALAVPLLFVASRRRIDRAGRLHMSRSAAFYSATLILVGGYLLFMSAVGYYVRFSGGDWGRALQLALLCTGIACLIALGLSGSLRAWLRVFIGKHFFSYRYDYREEWLRFTAMLSNKGTPEEMGGLVIRGLANMVESPGGGLWLLDGRDDACRQIARWNAPMLAEPESMASEFSRFLAASGWVIDIDEYRASPRLYKQLSLPTWALASADLWLVVPLRSNDALLGFVTLARPRTRVELNWEVRDLLKTAGQQAAGFLAQMQATEALLEARKFEAFNRMSAFVVHDLKNIVSQLALMLKNAERHHDNPEFQRDMLLTVESALDKMRRLMLQLREGAAPPGSVHGVELAPILDRLAASARARARQIDVEADDGLATRGHEERLERVLGHLVDNALDATPAHTGRVRVRAVRSSGQVTVEVQDNGVGMSEEFVRSRLFRPFSSTKTNGMGIGTYESFQYIRELGGAIDVDSKVDQGTVIRLTLPLFEGRSRTELANQAPA